jgi:hypothetical protein
VGNKRKYSKNWILWITACLLCLTLFSSNLMSGLLAKYTTGTNADDDARVAKFDITSENMSQTKALDIYMQPGKQTLDQKIQITNKSEVAVAYSIELKNETGNLPLELTIEDLQANDTAVSGTTYQVSAQESKTTFTYTLNVNWTDQSDDYMGMVDYVTVTVKATQID